MSVTVNGAGGYCKWKTLGWEMLLQLARMYGWKSAVSVAPDDFPRQEVSAEGARKLADALERALPDIPRHNAAQHKAETICGMRMFSGDVPLSPLELFSGFAGRRLLREFIAFCRAGEFWFA